MAYHNYFGQITCRKGEKMFMMFHNGKEPNMRETEEWGNPDKIKEVLSLLNLIWTMRRNGSSQKMTWN